MVTHRSRSSGHVGSCRVLHFPRYTRGHAEDSTTHPLHSIYARNVRPYMTLQGAPADCVIGAREHIAPPGRADASARTNEAAFDMPPPYRHR